MKNILIISGMVFIFISCGSNDQKETPAATVNSDKSTTSIPKANIDSLVKAIDMEREKIENNLAASQKKSLPTAGLREQIKQKWSRIEFFSQNDQLVRIKTFPYENISRRTEEFYFQNGKLVLAFIEDEGLEHIGKSEKRTGKTYYFFNDAVIKEDNQTNEKETTIRTSDGERLLQEAKEYLELFPKN
jgi:hypothetical protein